MQNIEKTTTIRRNLTINALLLKQTHYIPKQLVDAIFLTLSFTYLKFVLGRDCTNIQIHNDKKSKVFKIGFWSKLEQLIVKNLAGNK